MVIFTIIVILILIICFIYFLPATEDKSGTNYGESTFIIQTGGYY